MDDMTAMAFVGEEFERLHPRATWPEWLRRCTVASWTRDDQGRFVISYSVSFKEPLGEGEHWEKIEGNWYVVWIDPKTSEKRVVFRTPRRTEVYFKAAVEPETAEVTVLIDKDLSSFVGEELMGPPGPSE